MNLAAVFFPATTVVDLNVADKAALLGRLAQIASTTANLPAGEIEAALVKREELGSTGLGGGVAIPHARVAELKTPCGVIARLRRPIDFAAIDGQAVDLVVLLLLCGQAGSDQLNLLAAVARRLRDPEAVRAFRAAKGPQQLLELFTRPA